MRTPRLLPLLALAALLAGCGDRRLVLQVDVLSYLDPAARSTAFDVPPSPSGTAVPETALVDSLGINLLEGLDDVVDVESVTLSVHSIVTATSGSATGTLRAYAADPGTDPRTTAPFLVQPFTLQAGVTDTIRTEAAGGAELARLFAGRRMVVTVTSELQVPASGVTGSLTLTRFHATVIARRAEL